MLWLFESAVGSNIWQIEFLVWSHRRFGKNRLCVHPPLFLCLSAGFWSSSGIVQKNFLPHPRVTKLWETQGVFFITLNSGATLLLTAPISAQRSTAFLEFVSNKSAFFSFLETSFCLLTSALHHSYSLFPLSLHPTFSLSLYPPFALLLLTLHIPQPTLPHLSQPLRSNHLLVWPTSTIDWQLGLQLHRNVSCVCFLLTRLHTFIPTSAARQSVRDPVVLSWQPDTTVRLCSTWTS